MKAINFPQANANVAEDQEQYNTLPSCICREDNNLVNISCFELNDEEISSIVRTKKLWHRALTFGKPLQPFNIFAIKDYFSPELPFKTNTNLKIETDLIVTASFWKRFRFLLKGSESFTFIQSYTLPNTEDNIDIILKQK